MVNTLSFSKMVTPLQVDFIKMDIEGNEPFALFGMTGVLSQPRVMMIFEYIDGAVSDPAPFFARLRSYGFYLFQIEHPLLLLQNN